MPYMPPSPSPHEHLQEKYAFQCRTWICGHLSQDVIVDTLELTRDYFRDSLEALRYENEETGEMGMLLCHQEDNGIMREVRQSKNLRRIAIYDFKNNMMLTIGAQDRVVLTHIIPETRERLSKWYGLSWDNNLIPKAA